VLCEAPLGATPARLFPASRTGCVGVPIRFVYPFRDEAIVLMPNKNLRGEYRADQLFGAEVPFAICDRRALICSRDVPCELGDQPHANAADLLMPMRSPRPRPFGRRPTITALMIVARRASIT
jgi:hypothetical protein